MVVETHGPSAVAVRLANRNVQIGDQIGPDACSGRLLLAHRIKAPFARHLTHEPAAPGDVERASLGIIVGPRHVADRPQAQIVSGKFKSLPGPQHFDLFGCPACHACYSGNGDPHSGMGNDKPVECARRCAGESQRRRQRYAAQARTICESGKRTGDQPHRHGHECRSNGVAAKCEDQHKDRGKPARKRRVFETTQRGTKIVAFPFEYRSDDHDQQHRDHDRNERPVIVRRSHRNLVAAHHVDEKRIECSKKHGSGGRAQQHVVDGQPALSADQREGSAIFEMRRTDGIEGQGAAGGEQDQCQDEDASRRIQRKCVHACQHAGTNQKCADQTERKRQDCEQDRPAHERIATLDDKSRMQQCSARDPRHERRIFDRIPEPPAAPAKRIIRPGATKRDPNGEEAPRRQHPGPHPTRPASVDLSIDQRCHRERKRHRKTDITQIKKRRMDRESWVLQYWIKPVTI